VDKSTRSLVVAPGIQSVEQLRGEAIAVNSIGSGPYNTGVLALEHFGVDPQREVTWLTIGGPAERVVAVQQGGARATIMSGAEIPQAESAWLVVLLRLDEIAPLPETGVGTTQTKLETQPGQVKRVLRAIVHALQYLNTNREGSIPVYMQFLSLSREEAERAHDATAYSYSLDGTVPERSLRYTIESEKQQLQLTEDVPFARVANFAPLYEVLNELGIQPTPGSAR
jgi:ABC-type nitrate/sulfonate/bicarbonate transport system substrate-binding protein